jgi:protein TonB
MIAIGIHCLLISMDSDWMNFADSKLPPTGSVTITLESIQPRTIQPKAESMAAPPSARKIPKSVIQKQHVKTTKEPENMPVIPKPDPAKPAEPQKPATPQPSRDSLPDRRMPPQQEANPVDSGPVAAMTQEATGAAAIENALPEYGRNPQIPYPKGARQKGYEGTVMLEVLVNQNGTVDDLKILTSSGYAILDRSAVNGVKTWFFKPAKKGKDPVEMWVQVPVQFKLE